MKKKVFISWSKPQSKAVATVLVELLAEVLDGVDLFMSDRDIGPGERSMKVIESELDDTSFGVIVTTAENQNEAWLNFEAGALAKQVAKDENDLPRVIPLLVDLDNPSQLVGPISQFQAVNLDKSGVQRIATALADLVGTETRIISARFARAWYEYGPKLETAARTSSQVTTSPSRSVGDKVDEALEILRRLERLQPLGEAKQSGLSTEPGLILSEPSLHALNEALLKTGSRILDYSILSGDLDVQVPSDFSVEQRKRIQATIKKYFPSVERTRFVRVGESRLAKSSRPVEREVE